jgi:hypothetical protein
MSPVDQVLEAVSKAGLSMCLTETGSIKASPPDLITPGIRQLIKTNKQALVKALRPAEHSLPVHAPALSAEAELERQLVEAAMRACDHWGDSPAAKAEMLADIHRTPQHQRLSLLEHFLAAYGMPKG